MLIEASLAEAWENYRRMCILDEVRPVDLEIMKELFYAGTLAFVHMAKVTSLAVELGQMHAAEREAIHRTWLEEMTAYCADRAEAIEGEEIEP